MKINIVHVSDWELNPTLTGKTAAKLSWMQKKDIWKWLFENAIDLLDKIRENRRTADEQILLIPGDVVKGCKNVQDGVKEYWQDFNKILHDVDKDGTRIYLTTGSHDHRAIEAEYPLNEFYDSKPYKYYSSKSMELMEEDGNANSPWVVIKDPEGRRLDICNDKISLIAYGDLDGIRGKENKNKYDQGRAYWATQKDSLTPRFVIAMSPDHYPGIMKWADDNIYCYVAVGGAEGHEPGTEYRYFRGRTLNNKYFLFSRQGRPFRCAGWKHGERQPWTKIFNSITYGVVDTDSKQALFKELDSEFPVFSVDERYGKLVDYNPPQE